MPPMTFFEPGLAPFSIRATWSPARAIVMAAAVPAGPAPTTIESSLSSSDTAGPSSAVVRTVGLTGGIGTGKSTVSGMLRELGATVIDADEATRTVQAPGSEGLRQLVEAFGPGIRAPSGELDRAALAEIAFRDPAARERLNGIVHPLVRAEMAQRQAEAAERGDPVV